MKVPSDRTVTQILKICGGLGTIGTVCEVAISTDWAQKKILKHNLAKSTIENPRITHKVYLLDIVWLVIQLTCMKLMYLIRYI